MSTSKKLVFGMGINDSAYVTQYTHYLEGRKVYWICPFYSRWKSMLERVFSKIDLERNPTNIGNSISEEWLKFSNFRAWMEKQPWDQGKLELDKDILVLGNKTYSKDTCAFVPHYLNSLFLRKQRFRGDYPLGVNKRSGKANYSKPLTASISSTSKQGKRKRIHLGYFSDTRLAHKAWQIAKMKEICIVLNKYKQDPSYQENVYRAIESRISLLNLQVEQGVETTII